MMSKDEKGKKIDRRQFLKVTGAAGAVAGSAGLGFFGYQAGKDPHSYTGARTLEGADQTFDREKFASDTPPFEKVGPTSRVDPRSGMIFYRVSLLMRQWDGEKGIESLLEPLKSYYKQHPRQLELDLALRSEVFPKMRQDNKTYGHQFKLATAWSHAMAAVWPKMEDGPPEVSDFSGVASAGPLKMKSPDKTAQLIKKVAHQLGATLVGITKLNPDWVFSYPMRRRGFELDKPLEIPKHWQYAIVIGTPMAWDPMFANPNYGTSEDAYAKSRIVAFRLAAYIKQLGYPARPHTPGTDYDLMVPPIAVEAGLGEIGRHSVLVTPELGSNIRPAVVTTSIPMTPDKPIEFGVKDFCKTCKICAEQCPSGAITMGEPVEVRGYKKYQLDSSKCHNFWFSNLGNMGCRICVAVCPYSRKSNWLHRTALEVTAHDPTGLSHAVLTEMQKAFYPSPDPGEYYSPSFGGSNASYRQPPWWLRSEDFIDFSGGGK
jgi:reductive dehalogenase